VEEVIGYLKKKSSTWIAQNVERKARNFLGHKLWARGYFVSTIDRNKGMTCAYIKNPGDGGQAATEACLPIKSNFLSQNPS
jgi:REP element-mobilizing transposase RayT